MANGLSQLHRRPMHDSQGVGATLDVSSHLHSCDQDGWGYCVFRAARAWVGANINDPANAHLCRLDPKLDPTLGPNPTCLDSIIAQLENNRNLFTGLYGFCGHRFGRGGKLYAQPKCSMNSTGGTTCNAYSGDQYLSMMQPLMQYCRDNGIEVSLASGTHSLSFQRLECVSR